MIEFDLQKNKGHRQVIATFMDVLPCDAGNVSHHPSLEKLPKFFTIFKLYQIHVKGIPELMLVPGPDCSLNGPEEKIKEISSKCLQIILCSYLASDAYNSFKPISNLYSIFAFLFDFLNTIVARRPNDLQRI